MNVESVMGQREWRKSLESKDCGVVSALYAEEIKVLKVVQAQNAVSGGKAQCQTASGARDSSIPVLPATMFKKRQLKKKQAKSVSPLTLIVLLVIVLCGAVFAANFFFLRKKSAFEHKTPHNRGHHGHNQNGRSRRSSEILLDDSFEHQVHADDIMELFQQAQHGLPKKMVLSDEEAQVLGQRLSDHVREHEVESHRQVMEGDSAGHGLKSATVDKDSAVEDKLMSLLAKMEQEAADLADLRSGKNHDVYNKDLQQKKDKFLDILKDRKHFDPKKQRMKAEEVKAMAEVAIEELKGKNAQVLVKANVAEHAVRRSKSSDKSAMNIPLPEPKGGDKCFVCDRPKDVRAPECRGYVDTIDAMDQSQLPDTSVIFTFCNEPFSSLYHSIHSVLETAPRHLLKEIILVDDGSELDWYIDELYDHIDYVNGIYGPGTIKMIRLGKRSGLMVARVEGAKVATGKVLTFLDSHISPQEGWLQVMMKRISEDSHHVVMPIIDGLSQTFDYSAGGIELVGFNTQIVDHGMGLQKKDQFPGRTAVDPQPSPAMAGGLFSIHKDFFFEIGAFDEHMEYWGGENIEISFRIWMCGGTLELLPCARIGHIFGGMRNPNKCGWKSNKNVGAVNKWRAIEVWMGDKHKDIMKEFLRRPSDEQLGDLTNMIKIRDGLQCKSFDWFLEEVYPECWMNMMEHALYKGNLLSEKFKDSNLCLHQPGGRGALKGMADCSKLHAMRMSKQGELVLRDIDTCLEVCICGVCFLLWFVSFVLTQVNTICNIVGTRGKGTGFVRMSWYGW